MGTSMFVMNDINVKTANLYTVSEITWQNSSLNMILLYGGILAVLIIFLSLWMMMYHERNQLEKIAYHDHLTNLPNRHKMNRFLEKNMGDHHVGILFIDLDRFKLINDTLGHEVGDLLLQAFSKRLQTFIHADQKVFRIGGDEFLVAIKSCDIAYAKQLAEEILEKNEQAYYIKGHKLLITVSIGICIDLNERLSPSVILNNADRAMYIAKEIGRNEYCVYDHSLDKQEKRKMVLEKDLWHVLEYQQLYVVYQPKWDVKAHKLSGWEVLLRWRHPQLGLIGPSEFIPIAESNGGIGPITYWTLEHVCMQAKLWQQQGIDQPVFVNLSAQLFQSGTLYEWVQIILDKTGLLPCALVLEITESMVLYNVDEVIQQLKKIRKLGVRISMDNFGTGYSSIGLLDQLPIDFLKLDRTFIHGIESPKKYTIVQAIMLMAENIGFEVIAEGVETKEQVGYLTNLGCNILLGYYYSKPMQAEQASDWVDVNSLQMHQQHYKEEKALSTC